MRRLGHPSMRTLERWVNGENTSIERHLATCSYCADRLESAHEHNDDGIRSALLTLLAVPDQLPERLQQGIDQRMSAQNDLTLIGEFFGLPFRTVRLMSTKDQGDS